MSCNVMMHTVQTETTKKKANTNTIFHFNGSLEEYLEMEKELGK